MGSMVGLGLLREHMQLKMREAGALISTGHTGSVKGRKAEECCTTDAKARREFQGKGPSPVSNIPGGQNKVRPEKCPLEYRHLGGPSIRSKNSYNEEMSGKGEARFQRTK